MGGREALEGLKRALNDGEWWAPMRTAAIRIAAASAMRQMGTPEANAALTEASQNGSRGVRNAARQQLARGLTTRRPPARSEEA
jgi:HEAT repeat protein